MTDTPTLRLERDGDGLVFVSLVLHGLPSGRPYVFALDHDDAAALESALDGSWAETILRQRDEAITELDEARAELNALRGSRLLSVVFGHHKGAPRPFALYGKGRSLYALGAEFPDGAVALRLANDGGWTTRSGGGADAIARAGVGMEIVWLSDELEPLAEMEQERDALRGELDRRNKVIATSDRIIEEEIAERDRYHELADRLAAAIAPAEVIGEHSSDNNPWLNAIEIAERGAKADEARTQLAEARARSAAERDVIDKAIKLVGDWKANRSTHGGPLVAAVNVLDHVSPSTGDEGGTKP